MVDVVISSTNVTLSQIASPRQLVWISPSVGYTFYVRTTPTQRVVYRKTVDKGLTWGSEVILDDATPMDNTVSVHYDRWTSGDTTGTLIHIVMARFSTFSMRYINLNTATDVLSAAVTIDTVAAGTTVSHSITKTVDGTLFISQNGGNNASMDVNFWRSIDGGASWVGRSVVGAQFQRLDGRTKLIPANTANDNVGAIVGRTASSPNFYCEYDNTSDTWTSVALFTGTLQEREFQITVRHSDGHMLAALKDTGFDIRVFDINNVGDVVEKTQPVTGASGAITAGVEIFINQNNADIYVVYPRGAGVAPREIRYSKSTNGMNTWESEVIFSVASGNQSEPQAGLSVGADGGRMMPVWLDEDTDSWLTNFDNSIEISVVPIVPPPSPVPIIAAGHDQQAGTISYITPSPESRVYELITPHDPGRWVISFSGWGTPPIEYITQRAPFQDGETVKDFFLRPRIIQMLLRHNFRDRDAWWDGRATILNEIRPNRQATATAVVPGILRMVKTDGSVIDLNVFIQEGPRFEPRQSSQWDEWSFQEVLRFVAHNPIAFTPTRVDFLFTIVLDTDLVFPITFPITFGSGEIDLTPNITYTGTWLSFPVIVIEGPLEDFRLDNLTTGEKLEFSANVDPGRVVTIDTTEGFKTVTDDLGNNLIGILTSDSDLATFHIAPDPEAPLGVNAMRLQGKHPTHETSVEIRYFTRWFGI